MFIRMEAIGQRGNTGIHGKWYMDSFDFSGIAYGACNR